MRRRPRYLGWRIRPASAKPAHLPPACPGSIRACQVHELVLRKRAKRISGPIWDRGGIVDVRTERTQTTVAARPGLSAQRPCALVEGGRAASARVDPRGPGREG